MWRDVEAGDWTLGDLYRSFIGRDRGIHWPEDLKTRIHAVVGDAGEGDDQDLKTETSQAAVELLNTTYYTDFHTRVTQVASEPAPTPGSGGSGAPAPINVEWTRVILYMAGTTIEMPMMSRADFISNITQRAGPDLNQQFEDIKTDLAAGTQGPRPAIVQWGSSWISLAGEAVRTQTPPYNLMTFTAVFEPNDMATLNQPKLHALTAEGAFVKYAQYGKIVMLDPAAVDLRYAVIRWICNDRDGGDQARITRSGRKIKVRTVVPGYERDFEHAINPISDHRIEWV